MGRPGEPRQVRGGQVRAAVPQDKSELFNTTHPGPGSCLQDTFPWEEHLGDHFQCFPVAVLCSVLSGGLASPLWRGPGSVNWLLPGNLVKGYRFLTPLPQLPLWCLKSSICLPGLKCLCLYFQEHCKRLCIYFSLFPTAFQIFHTQAPLAFTARCSGGSSSLFRTPGLGAPWGAGDPALLGEKPCNCDYPPVCGIPHPGCECWLDHVSVPPTWFPLYIFSCEKSFLLVCTLFLQMVAL